MKVFKSKELLVLGALFLLPTLRACVVNTVLDSFSKNLREAPGLSQESRYLDRDFFRRHEGLRALKEGSFPHMPYYLAMALFKTQEELEESLSREQKAEFGKALAYVFGAERYRKTLLYSVVQELQPKDFKIFNIEGLGNKILEEIKELDFFVELEQFKEKPCISSQEVMAQYINPEELFSRAFIVLKDYYPYKVFSEGHWSKSETEKALERIKVIEDKKIAVAKKVESLIDKAYQFESKLLQVNIDMEHKISRLREENSPLHIVGRCAQVAHWVSMLSKGFFVPYRKSKGISIKDRFKKLASTDFFKQIKQGAANKIGEEISVAGIWAAKWKLLDGMKTWVFRLVRIV